MTASVQIDGLREFRRNLKELDKDLPKALRVALNDAADIIVSSARPKVRKASGRARSTVKARSTQSKARVVGGGRRAPYYPWLDFGGKIRGGPSRPFLKNGRYIYDAYFRHRDDFVDALERQVVKVATDAGLEVE